MIMKTSILLALLLSASLFAADAEQKPTADIKPGTIFRAGVGLIISEKAQKGADTVIMPVPTLFIKQGRFSLFGPQANFVLHYENDLLISAVAKLRSEGYDDHESSTLRGMDDRRMTLEAGLLASQKFSWGRLNAEWTSDVLNEHKGHEIRLTASHSFDNIFGVQKLSFTPSAGANWRSKQLNDYYYGVERKEATVWRPAYNVGSTVAPLASLRLDYPLSQRWDAFMIMSVEWLGSEITDSPIVNEHHLMSILIGTLYKF
jgi:outer membrane protein